MMNIGHKRISVVIATYNGEKFISEQLHSILNQSLKPNEIIISDNLSTDQTVKICKEMLVNFPEIDYSIVYENKKGVIYNFENALLNATGDYIFFCDQDDIWNNNKIELFMSVFIKYDNCNCVFSNSYLDLESNHNMIDELTKRERIAFIKNGFLDKTKFLTFELKKNIVTGMSMAITKDLKEFAMPLSKNVYHDYWCAINSVFLGDIYYLNYCTAYYRQHDNNVIGVNKKPRLCNILVSIKKSKSNAKRELDFLCELENKNISLNNNIFFRKYKRFNQERFEMLNSGSIFKIIRIRKVYKEYSDYINWLRDLIFLFLYWKEK